MIIAELAADDDKRVPAYLMTDEEGPRLNA
jgi:hypothetical protein